MTVERTDVKCRHCQERDIISEWLPGYRHEKLVLSVLVSVYNHERYLRTCIESIRMQKVDFPMEVLIAEDCSTDGSRRMLKEMEKEPGWPGSFHVIYREKNLGMWANGEDLYRRAKGRYVIVLEGDDYWLYHGKLQAQVDFLEGHHECSGCAHRTMMVREEGKPVSRGQLPGGRLSLGGRPFFRNYPECRHRHYTLADWCRFRLPGQTATLMLRRECLFPDIDSERFFFAEGYPRDQQKAFLLACLGDVYCFPEIWSAYRYHPESGTSFSGGEKVRWEPRRNFYRAAAQYLRRRMRCSGESLCDSFCRRFRLAVILPLLLLRGFAEWTCSPRE